MEINLFFLNNERSFYYLDYKWFRKPERNKTTNMTMFSTKDLAFLTYKYSAIAFWPSGM